MQDVHYNITYPSLKLRKSLSYNLVGFFGVPVLCFGSLERASLLLSGGGVA